jgi:hypothetical protein
VSRKLIRGGHVLSMDPAVGEYRSGDVLIDGGTNAAIGPAVNTLLQVLDDGPHREPS